MEKIENIIKSAPLPVPVTGGKRLLWSIHAGNSSLMGTWMSLFSNHIRKDVVITVAHRMTL